MRFTAVMTMAIGLGAAPAFAQAARGGGFEVRTLSARADMVSGDDVLITAPPAAGTNVTITVNGHEPNAEFKPSPPLAPSGVEGRAPSTVEGVATLIVRLKDLQLGPNLIEVGVKGQRPAVRLAVVNHPIAGPVMSGPHQTPFTCETQAFGLGQPLDTDCTVPTRVEYFYRSRVAR